jgi:hypothetical protein
MPDEPKEYSHGCGSPYQCRIAEVLSGYKARAAATGKGQDEFVRETEGVSKSYVGGPREKPKQLRRR